MCPPSQYVLFLNPLCTMIQYQLHNTFHHSSSPIDYLCHSLYNSLIYLLHLPNYPLVIPISLPLHLLLLLHSPHDFLIPKFSLSVNSLFHRPFFDLISLSNYLPSLSLTSPPPFDTVSCLLHSLQPATRAHDPDLEDCRQPVL